jgi:hypothetical protein
LARHGQLNSRHYPVDLIWNKKITGGQKNYAIEATSKGGLPLFSLSVKKSVSLVLIFSLLGFQFSPIAHAQVTDSVLIAQFRAIVSQLKETHPDFKDLQELSSETWIDEFRTHGLDTAETRDLLNRFEGIALNPEVAEPIFRQFKDWQVQISRYQGAAEEKYIPLKDFLGPPCRCNVHPSVFYGLSVWVITILHMLLFGLHVGCGNPSSFFPSTCQENLTLLGCVPTDTSLSIRCYECSIGTPPSWAKLSSHCVYEFFIPEAKMRFWALETGIPASLLIFPFIILAMRNLPVLVRTQMNQAQDKQIQQLQDQLFSDLKQLTGIPALETLIQAVVLSLPKEFTIVEIPSGELEALGAGATLPEI